MSAGSSATNSVGADSGTACWGAGVGGWFG